MSQENLSKDERYANLVRKRKEYDFSDGLQNPAKILGGTFDCDEIGAWSTWHSDLNAKILLIGQDWGCENYFINNQGKDSDDNQTCINLKKLFNEIGFYLGTAIPKFPNKNGLFFTNSVLGIKYGNMAARIKMEWLRNSTEGFTKELIEITEPEIIITLGKIAFRALQIIWPDLPSKDTLKSLVVRDDLKVNKGRIQVFPRFHCSGLGLRSRSLDRQKDDWRRILPFLSNRGEGSYNPARHPHAVLRP